MYLRIKITFTSYSVRSNLSDSYSLIYDVSALLELLEGGELFDRIVKKTCYSEKEARDLVHVLYRAIKYCHDRNVVHRHGREHESVSIS